MPKYIFNRNDFSAELHERGFGIDRDEWYTFQFEQKAIYSFDWHLAMKDGSTDYCISLLRIIYVLPEYRRQGVQDSILSLVTGICDERDCRLLTFARPFELASNYRVGDAISFTKCMTDAGETVLSHDNVEIESQKRRMMSYGFKPYWDDNLNVGDVQAAKRSCLLYTPSSWVGSC